VAGRELIGLPTTHFSKRTLFDRDETLSSGHAVQTSRKRLHFAGDTGYGPIFPELEPPRYDAGKLGFGRCALHRWRYIQLKSE
jgi:L-ascorbate metabolism protein UlaG (beta-lactamase superfamily)